LCFAACSVDKQPGIDRLSLVTRHNVVLNAFDSLGSLSVGNGEFAFTVDITGLQTFPRLYENGIPLGTQSQWAWHAFPNKENFGLKDVVENFESCDGKQSPYPVQNNKEASDFLRANPHRLQLGQVGLIITKSNGQQASISDLKNIRQELNLWNGSIKSTYEVEGNPVKVILYSLQDDDGIAARIESPLLSDGRIKAVIKFPYAKDCHTCSGADWSNEDKHSSKIDTASTYAATIARVIDSTRYFTTVSWDNGALKQTSAHEFQLASDNSDALELGVIFSRDNRPYEIEFDEVARYNIEHWRNFWTLGAAIDFSKCADPRAGELERRVVLSLYLTKIQCSGSMPPQETGLTMNSWYGKFHLEMHWWHSTHFALWNRASLMGRSLEWYREAVDRAKATATSQGYEGARWPKMTDPHAKESPSDIGAFIIWQQPHPVYLAELMYRDTPDKVILDRYSDIVFTTADFMASFMKERDGVYHLCHPLIPSQEIFKATETDDPTFELQYWRYALTVAQQWRQRLDMEPDDKWQKIINNIAALPVKDGMYLPTATAANIDRHDHPSVLAAFGVLPADERVDNATMLNTLNDIASDWHWETTWGWDYPMMAMTAARLGKPELAIDLLMKDTPKNTYLINGHNYQDKTLRLYLPGNGGLLAAVGMMAGGWDGSADGNPGFPKNGQWAVQSDGFMKMP
jgi:hypothetical protein